jgi:hypothetical protein
VQSIQTDQQGCTAAGVQLTAAALDTAVVAAAANKQGQGMRQMQDPVISRRAFMTPVGGCYTLMRMQQTVLLQQAAAVLMRHTVTAASKIIWLHRGSSKQA